MRFIIIFIFSNCLLAAQDFYTIVSASPFYTYGKYSNQVVSNSKAIYSSINLNGNFILSAGYDNISLKYNDWDYKQNSISGSGIVRISDLYLKFAGIKIRGDFIDNLFNQSYNYQDEVYSLSSELFYKYNWNYFGLGVNYTNSGKGYDTLKAYNLSLRYEFFLDYYTYLSFRPNFYFENSNKKLFSITSKLTHWFSPDFIGNINLTLGSRRYYFDNDLLTIYNQYETQKLVVGGSIDYSIIDEITVSAGYQHTKFESFSVNYLFVGLRTKLIFWFVVGIGFNLQNWVSKFFYCSKSTW